MTAGGQGGGGARREPGLWQQFRRRRVIRTVLLYLAFVPLAAESFLALSQVVAMPPWAFRAVLGVAVLGFPFAVVLAWTYDVTPSGIVKTPEEFGPEPPSAGPRRGWVLLGAGALVAALALRLLRM
jgi:hypothetical protein